MHCCHSIATSLGVSTLQHTTTHCNKAKAQTQAQAQSSAPPQRCHCIATISRLPKSAFLLFEKEPHFGRPLGAPFWWPVLQRDIQIEGANQSLPPNISGTTLPATMRTLQHTAPHCSTLQHAATNCNKLQHTAPHCTSLGHIASHCDTTKIDNLHLWGSLLLGTSVRELRFSQRQRRGWFLLSSSRTLSSTAPRISGQCYLAPNKRRRRFS